MATFTPLASNTAVSYIELNSRLTELTNAITVLETQMAAISAQQGYIHGYTITVASPGNSISITSGVARDDANTYTLKKTTTTTISTTTTGVNGLDAGVFAANTWYSVWMVSNGTTVAGLMSTSSSSPTMPSSYIYKRRVGYVRSNSTGTALYFMRQFGSGMARDCIWRETTYNTPFLVLNAVDVPTSTWTTYSLTSVVAPLSSKAYVTINCSSPTAAFNIRARAGGGVAFAVIFSTSLTSGIVRNDTYLILTNQTIDLWSDAASTENISMAVTGFVDDLSVPIV